MTDVAKQNVHGNTALHYYASHRLKDVPLNE